MHKNLWMASIAGLALAASASANVINLSDLSSDGGVDPADLDATMAFSVVGNQLTITVTNNALGYTLSEFLFNAPDDVTLTLDWSRGPRRRSRWKRGMVWGMLVLVALLLGWLLLPAL